MIRYCPSTLLKTKTEPFCNCALYKSSRILSFPCIRMCRLDYGAHSSSRQINSMDNLQKVKFKCYMLWPYTKFHADGYCGSFHDWHDVCNSSLGIPWSVLCPDSGIFSCQRRNIKGYIVPWLFCISLSDSTNQTLSSFPCYFTALGLNIG